MLIFRAWATCGTTIRILLTPIRYVTLHLRDRHGAALLCYRYRPKHRCMSEQRPYPIWFSCQCKSHPEWCEHYMKYLGKEFGVTTEGKGVRQ